MSCRQLPLQVALPLFVFLGICGIVKAIHDDKDGHSEVELNSRGGFISLGADDSSGSSASGSKPGAQGIMRREVNRVASFASEVADRVASFAAEVPTLLEKPATQFMTPETVNPNKVNPEKDAVPKAKVPDGPGDDDKDKKADDASGGGDAQVKQKATSLNKAKAPDGPGDKDTELNGEGDDPNVYAGPPGPPGMTGQIGDRGPRGPPGPSGAGVVGHPGQPGPPGPRGGVGETGEEGRQGKSGPQGIMGDTPPIFQTWEKQLNHYAGIMANEENETMTTNRQMEFHLLNLGYKFSQISTRLGAVFNVSRELHQREIDDRDRIGSVISKVVADNRDGKDVVQQNAYVMAKVKNTKEMVPLEGLKEGTMENFSPRQHAVCPALVAILSVLSLAVLIS